MATYYHYYKSPIGKLLLVGDGINLTALGFPYGIMKRKTEAVWTSDGFPFKKTVDQYKKFYKKQYLDFQMKM